MSYEALRDKIRKVHDEIGAGKPLDTRQREALDTVLGEVEAALAAEDSEADDSLAERLREAGLHLEESHPKITAAIGVVADALSRLGI